MHVINLTRLEVKPMVMVVLVVESDQTVLVDNNNSNNKCKKTLPLKMFKKKFNNKKKTNNKNLTHPLVLLNYVKIHRPNMDHRQLIYLQLLLLQLVVIIEEQMDILMVDPISSDVDILTVLLKDH